MVFSFVLNTVVETMTANGAKGVIGNIPAVTSLPYFTVVPHNPLNPNTIPEYAAQIPLLNAAYAPLNQAFAAIGYPDRQVFFDENEPSPVVIHDETLLNISPLLKFLHMMLGFNYLIDNTFIFATPLI